MAPGDSDVIARVTGIPEGRVRAAPIAPDGTVGEPQLVSAGSGGAPKVAIGADGTAVVVSPAVGGDGGIEAAVRRPGKARFGAPTLLAPGSPVTDWSAGVTAAGDVVVAWKDGETSDEPQGGGVLHAVVAPAGGPFGQPAVIEDQVFALTCAGGALTWVEGRPEGAYASIAAFTSPPCSHGARANPAIPVIPARPPTARPAPAGRAARRPRAQRAGRGPLLLRAGDAEGHLEGRLPHAGVAAGRCAPAAPGCWRSRPGEGAARDAQAAGRGRRRQRPHGPPGRPARTPLRARHHGERGAGAR